VIVSIGVDDPSLAGAFHLNLIVRDMAACQTIPAILIHSTGASY
jgi:hypothetical protein